METNIRCYAASQEVRFPNVHRSRVRNFQLLKRAKTANAMTRLIGRSLPRDLRILRVHASGDLFSQAYLDAWIRVATERSDVLFYGYTKSIPFWVRRLNQIPPNLVLTASMGGKHDRMALNHDLKRAYVLLSTDTDLPIDHDDSLAMDPSVKQFGLLLHGVQPKGSAAALARSRLVQLGFKGYGG